jgi:hypothetical protein
MGILFFKPYCENCIGIRLNVFIVLTIFCLSELGLDISCDTEVRTCWVFSRAFCISIAICFALAILDAAETLNQGSTLAAGCFTEPLFGF